MAAPPAADHHPAGRRDHAGTADVRGLPAARRPGGTRNYIAIISTVNCSASTSKYIAERGAPACCDDFPNVDGVVAITHKGGCGMQYDGPDHEQLDGTLAGFAEHPNVAAYMLVGLGCENGQATHLHRQDGHVMQLDPRHARR